MLTPAGPRLHAGTPRAGQALSGYLLIFDKFPNSEGKVWNYSPEFETMLIGQGVYS